MLGMHQLQNQELVATSMIGIDWQLLCGDLQNVNMHLLSDCFVWLSG